MDTRQFVLKTLAYFDLFDYPLTKDELLRFLWRARVDNIAELDGVLKKLLLEKLIDTRSEFYFLTGRENSVAQREKSAQETEKKLFLARRAVKLIRTVPFLRAVFACNSVGAGAATADSDIDFFIITAPGRIWIVRLFTNLILRLFGLRTYGDRRANKICLSFYVDFNHLNFSSWRVVDDDVYLAYWLYQLIPLYDPDNYYRRLLAANGWTKEFLPGAIQPSGNFSEAKISRVGVGWKKIWEKMWSKAYGDLLEKQAKGAQWQKLKLSIKDAAARHDSAVVIEEGIIKLHENDRRAEYREQWLNKIKQFSN